MQRLETGRVNKMKHIIYAIAALAVLAVAFDAKADEASDETLELAAGFITCAVDQTTDADILENLENHPETERMKVSVKVFIVYDLALKEFKKCGLDLDELPFASGVTMMAMFAEELQSQMRYGSIGR